MSGSGEPMNGEPNISVITACRNHGRYVPHMLASVLGQTVQDVEVLIVNDGSTDDTRKILDDIVHERVRVFHTPGRGPAAARNFAIERARAPIIMNLDADDAIAPGLLEKALAAFRDNPGCGIVHCDAACFGARTGPYAIGRYTPEAMLFDNRIIAQAFFKKEDWRTVGGYSTELEHGLEDWDFWLLILELGRSVVRIPEALVYYRTYRNPADCRTGQVKRDREKMLATLFTIFHRHERLYAACPAAWRHFSRMEEKLNREHPLVRRLKNRCYRLLKRHAP